jgi:Beta protein
MANHIYIPIIKAKKNDLLAFTNSSKELQELMKPLIELPPTPSKETTNSHLEKFLLRLDKFDKNLKMFVDFYGFLPGEKCSSTNHATISGYELLHSAGRIVTPVYGFGRDDSLWSHLARVIKLHGEGFCFRIDSDDLEEEQAEATWDGIQDRAAQLGLDISDIDLLLDLRDVRIKGADDQVELITTFMAYQPTGTKFRSLSISGSSAPKDVTVAPKDSILPIFRNELEIWARLKNDLVNGDQLIYSDYGVIHPDFAADDMPVGGTANCKIRYTVGNSIILFRGHKRAGDTAQIYNLAEQVRSHSQFCGRSFSDGDRYIYDVANLDDGPGNLGNWVHADMSHHLKFATLQIEHLQRRFTPNITLKEIEELLDETI